MAEQIVIVGAGLAGLRTVERLRDRGYAGRITLIGAEGRLPYDRPPLSKEVLRGERNETWLRPEGDYADLGVEVMVGTPATGLDTGRRLVMAGEEQIAYDVLVIATGARPRRVPGLSGHVLRTWEDALALREALVPGHRLVIVGAGLIGCEVAAIARSLGLDVTLIDALAGPLVRVVGPVASGFVADLHREHGVELRLGVTVSRTAGDDLELSDGSVVTADVVLQAVGAAPDVDWLGGSGVPVADGVVCDAVGRTTIDGVYAVGDVACWDGVRAEHWSSAVAQADRVVAAILGQQVPPAEVPYWWSDQYGVKIQGLGAPRPDDDVKVLAWGPKGRVVALYSRRGRLTGALGFSAAPAVLGLRDAIASAAAVVEVLPRMVAGSPVASTSAAPGERYMS